MFKSLFRLAAVTAGAAALLAIGADGARAQQNWLDDFFNGRSTSSGGSFFSSSGRHTVGFPARYSPNQIVVSFADRRLYYVTRKGQAISYPIAIPKGEARWSGVLSVSSKRVNPDWTPTADMRRENPKLPAYVPGGDPRNPMGVRALYLGSTLYRIHGTDAPWLIGQEVSKGCIRMHNSDVIDLYERTRLGTRVTVTWNRYSTS
ncbi:MAG: L,D-transpeptidase [Rhodomicrobium sp.]|nr:L,D-transpeptidase [Rhodomicrobium sp.]